MNIIVLGATGATGKMLVTRALEQKHSVTAFVRDPKKLGVEHPSLKVVQGDVLDPASLAKAIPGHDAVFFCVGPGHKKASTVRTEGAKNTVAAMTASGVKRIVALSGLGAGVTRESKGFVFSKLIAPTLLRGLLEDQNGLEAAVRMSSLDWIVVRPGEMTDDAKGRPQKIVVSLDGTGITDEVGRDDVVKFLLGQLHSDEYLRRPVCVGY